MSFDSTPMTCDSCETLFYPFKFVCIKCNKIFDAVSTVRPKTDSWIRGFMCDECSKTITLQEFDFEI